MGKTTTAIQLVAGLEEKGFRVLACDLDHQANLTMTLMGDAEQKVRTDDGRAPDREAAIEAAALPALQPLIPAKLAQEAAVHLDSAIGDQPNKLFLLREALHEASELASTTTRNDTPPRETLSPTTPTAADGVVIPAEAAEYSLGGIADLAGVDRDDPQVHESGACHHRRAHDAAPREHARRARHHKSARRSWPKRSVRRFSHTRFAKPGDRGKSGGVHGHLRLRAQAPAWRVITCRSSRK